MAPAWLCGLCGGKPGKQAPGSKLKASHSLNRPGSAEQDGPGSQFLTALRSSKGRARLSPNASRHYSGLLSSRASHSKEQDAAQQDAVFSFPDHIPELTKQQSLRIGGYVSLLASRQSNIRVSADPSGHTNAPAGNYPQLHTLLEMLGAKCSVDFAALDVFALSAPSYSTLSAAGAGAHVLPRCQPMPYALVEPSCEVAHVYASKALSVYDAAVREEPLPQRCEQLHRATGLPAYMVLPVMNGADCVAALTLGHTHAAALRELSCGPTLERFRALLRDMVVSERLAVVASLADALVSAESIDDALAGLGQALSYLLYEKLGGLTGVTVIPVVVGTDGRSALLMLDGGAYLEAARYSASTGTGAGEDAGQVSGSYAVSGRNMGMRDGEYPLSKVDEGEIDMMELDEDELLLDLINAPPSQALTPPVVTGAPIPVSSTPAAPSTPAAQVMDGALPIPLQGKLPVQRQGAEHTMAAEGHPLDGAQGLMQDEAILQSSHMDEQDAVLAASVLADAAATAAVVAKQARPASISMPSTLLAIHEGQVEEFPAGRESTTPSMPSLRHTQSLHVPSSMRGPEYEAQSTAGASSISFAQHSVASLSHSGTLPTVSAHDHLSSHTHSVTRSKDGRDSAAMTHTSYSTQADSQNGARPTDSQQLMLTSFSTQDTGSHCSRPDVLGHGTQQLPLSQSLSPTSGCAQGADANDARGSSPLPVVAGITSVPTLQPSAELPHSITLALPEPPAEPPALPPIKLHSAVRHPTQWQGQGSAATNTYTQQLPQSPPAVRPPRSPSTISAAAQDPGGGIGSAWPWAGHGQQPRQGSSPRATSPAPTSPSHHSRPAQSSDGAGLPQPGASRKASKLDLGAHRGPSSKGKSGASPYAAAVLAALSPLRGANPGRQKSGGRRSRDAARRRSTRTALIDDRAGVESRSHSFTCSPSRLSLMSQHQTRMSVDGADRPSRDTSGSSTSGYSGSTGPAPRQESEARLMSRLSRAPTTAPQLSLVAPPSPRASSRAAAQPSSVMLPPPSSPPQEPLPTSISPASLAAAGAKHRAAAAAAAASRPASSRPISGQSRPATGEGSRPVTGEEGSPTGRTRPRRVSLYSLEPSGILLRMRAPQDQTGEQDVAGQVVSRGAEGGGVLKSAVGSVKESIAHAVATGPPSASGRTSTQAAGACTGVALPAVVATSPKASPPQGGATASSTQLATSHKMLQVVSSLYVARELAAQGGDASSLLIHHATLYGRSSSAGRAEAAHSGPLLGAVDDRRSVSMGRAQSACGAPQANMMKTLLMIGSGRKGQTMDPLGATLQLVAPPPLASTGTATGTGTATADTGSPSEASASGPPTTTGTTQLAITSSRAEGSGGGVAGGSSMGALEQMARSSLLLIDPVVAGIAAGLASGRTSTAALSSLVSHGSNPGRGSVLFTGSLYSSRGSQSGVSTQQSADGIGSALGMQQLLGHTTQTLTQHAAGPLLRKLTEEVPNMEGDIVGKVMQLEGTLLGALLASGHTTQTTADCHALLAGQGAQAASVLAGSTARTPPTSQLMLHAGSGVLSSASGKASAAARIPDTFDLVVQESAESPRSLKSLKQQANPSLTGPARIQVGGTAGGKRSSGPGTPPPATPHPLSPHQPSAQQPFFDLLLLRKPRACIVAQLALGPNTSSHGPLSSSTSQYPTSAAAGLGATPEAGSSLRSGPLSMIFGGQGATSGKTTAAGAAVPAAAGAPLLDPAHQSLPPRNVLAFYVHIADRLQPYLLDDLSRALQQVLHTLQPLLSDVLLNEHGEAWAAIQEHVLRPSSKQQEP